MTATTLKAAFMPRQGFVIRRPLGQLIGRLAFVLIFLPFNSAYADLQKFCTAAPPPAANPTALKLFNEKCPDYLSSQFDWYRLDGKTITAISGACVGVLGLVGGLLIGWQTYRLGRIRWMAEWQTETRQDIYRARFDEGTKFLDTLSDLTGKRFFLLQRYFWAIKNSESIDNVNKKEAHYFKAVVEWNSCFWKNRNNIRLFTDEMFANEFLDYKDEGRSNPVSLHYKFWVAHDAVYEMKINGKDTKRAGYKVAVLNGACSTFLERLTAEFLKRASQLELLEVPLNPGGAELKNMQNQSHQNSEYEEEAI